jgi:hypothetical protein
MSYWEFLIQREDDRAWKTLTSPNLQIVEGKYRIVANTTAIGSAVKTQVFYHNSDQPPQLSQSRSQVISPEGMLVVLPFTHLQTGMWQFHCNVSLTEDQEICYPLKLKVLPRTIPAPLEPVSIAEQQPTEIMQTAVGDLDRLLDDLEKAPVTITAVSETSPVTPKISSISPEITTVRTPSFEELPITADPFAEALRIATAEQNARSRHIPVGQPKTEPTLEQILASTEMEAIVLGTPDVPLHSYDVRSYEVVVED